MRDLFTEPSRKHEQSAWRSGIDFVKGFHKFLSICRCAHCRETDPVSDLGEGFVRLNSRAETVKSDLFPVMDKTFCQSYRAHVDLWFIRSELMQEVPGSM